MTIYIRRATNGQYYWYVRAANNEILCTSETYVSKAGAENGARALKSGVGSASIVDVSKAA